jgi:hypothetical protein
VLPTGRALRFALSLPALLGAMGRALDAQASSGGPVAGRGAPIKGAPVVAGPPLAAFAEGRVAVVPIQSWRADTLGWTQSVTWAQLRLTVDSAVAAELQDRGMGRRWASPLDVVRLARRNPTFQSDPYALGVGRWRAMLPETGASIPSPLADHLRVLTALGDTRHVLVPVELRVEGEVTRVRLVLADTRARTVQWAGDLVVPGGARLASDLAERIADLFLEP